MLMRYHCGLGVGHTYDHGQQSVGPDLEPHLHDEDENLPDVVDVYDPSTSGEFECAGVQSGSEKSDLYSEDDSGDGWDKDFEDDDIDISDDEEFHALDEMYGSAP
jgi:hypothetical protein